MKPPFCMTGNTCKRCENDRQIKFPLVLFIPDPGSRCSTGTYVDGGFGYRIHGRLIDAKSGKPLTNRLILFDYSLAPIPQQPDASQYQHATTREDGKFETELFGGLADMHSPPKPLGMFQVAVCVDEGGKIYTTRIVNLPGSSNDLGDLKVSLMSPATTDQTGRE